MTTRSYENDFLALNIDEGQKIWAKILRMASAREYSSQQVRSKLLHAGYPEALVDDALERAMNLRIIDDERYSDSLIRRRVASGKGLKPAIREIEELGVNPSQLASYGELYNNESDEAEVDRALSLLNKKPPRSKNLREGAFRKLVQAGYSADVASQASRIWVDNLAQTH